MALRPATLVAVAGFMTALAGCSGGSDDSGYPNAYMLGTYGVPDGFELLDEDSNFWNGAAQQYGLESNPGYADPETWQGQGDDGDDDEAPRGPAPARLYVAVYVNESGSSEWGFPPMIISMAVEMANETDFDAAMEEEDVCEGADDGEEAGFFFLRDGRYAAVTLAIGADVATEISDAAAEMRAATGAVPLCEDDGEDDG